MTEQTPIESGGRAILDTAKTVETLLRGSDTRLVVSGIALGYFVLYSTVVGQLTPGTGAVDLFVVSDPVARAFQQTGTLAYEPIARIDLVAVSYLFSPLNFGLAAVLSTLVALNLSLSYLTWRYPKACDVGASSQSAGLVASVPALLSGAACCGPVLFIVLGVQATGFLLAAFSSLVPVAIGLLVVTLIYTGRTIDQHAVRSGE